MDEGVSEVREHWETFVGLARVTSPPEGVRFLRGLEAEELRFVDRLVNLSERGTNELLSEADPEEANVVSDARRNLASIAEFMNSELPFTFSSRFVDIRGYPYLDLESGRTFIRLVFRTAEGEFVASDQDLEDSLGIAAEVLESVAKAANRIRKRLGASIDQLVLGDNAKNGLQSVERSTAEIRRLWSGDSLAEGDESGDDE